MVLDPPQFSPSHNKSAGLSQKWHFIGIPQWVNIKNIGIPSPLGETSLEPLDRVGSKQAIGIIKTMRQAGKSLRAIGSELPELGYKTKRGDN